jgi:hypothetical protein
MRSPVTAPAPETVSTGPSPAVLKSAARARKALALQRARRARLYTRRGLASYQAIAHPDTTVGKLLESYREALTVDAGGEDNLSAAKSMLIETAAVSLIIVRCLDGYILRRLGEPGELDPATLPVLSERRATADSLRGSLKLLGLSRQAKSVETLDQYLERTAEEREARQREQEQLEQTPDQEQTRIEES